MLLDKAQEQEEMDSALLDRIETLLGFQPKGKENGKGQPLSPAVPHQETT
jgi:hypothetical protein